MKVRYALTVAAAVALVFVGAGGANATGSTGCTSSNYVHQYTKNHGTICYTNTGFDDLSTSGFWTSEITAGSNTGYAEFYLDSADKNLYVEYFQPGDVLNFSGRPGGVVSLVGLGITHT